MRRPRLRFQRRQRGAIAIMVALSMLVLIGVAGLVIDGGMAYLVKARLNAAVDSAALAGARAVTNGANQAAQTLSAQNAAATYFAANIPSKYMLSTPQLVSTTVTFDAGTAIIDVRARAPMSVSLMRVLGFTTVTPAAYAQTIRRDLDMAFVVDNSGSLYDSREDVKRSATTFLNQFNVTQDRVALIHFATGAEVDNPIEKTARGFNRTSMLANVSAFNFSGATSSVEGMWHARDQLNSIAAANRSSMRVIVFFSDGEPTSFGTSLTYNTSTDCTLLNNPIVGIVNSSGQGLFRPDVSEYSYFTNSSCLFSYRNGGGAIEIWDAVKKLPDFYNAHSTSVKEFPIVTNTPRVVTNDVSSADIAKRNLDRAARNLPEAVAAKARSEGIVVMTLGLGAALKQPSGYDNELGETVLKCMANVADGPSRCYNPNQPVGMYCYAATTSDLTPCFSRLASAILRISK